MYGRLKRHRQSIQYSRLLVANQRKMAGNRPFCGILHVAPSLRLPHLKSKCAAKLYEKNVKKPSRRKRVKRYLNIQCEDSFERLRVTNQLSQSSRDPPASTTSRWIPMTSQTCFALLPTTSTVNGWSKFSAELCIRCSS